MKYRSGLAAALAAWVAASLMLPSRCFAWGDLGHRMVAETASLLLKENVPGWGEILSNHRFRLGYYAVLPDTVFRREDGNGGKTEGPTHFFDVDLILGKTPKQALAALDGFPRAFSEAKKRVPRLSEEGTAPWRVDQFLKLAREELKGITRVPGGYQSGREATDDRSHIYRGLYLLGVMAHYSGDASMPHHAVSDYNGWAAGEGNIHFYFEADCVNALEPGLSTSVLQAARARQKQWAKEWKVREDTPVGSVMRLFIDSLGAVPEVSRIDKKHVVLAPSDEAKKRPAKRKDPDSACRWFRPLLVERLAKAAVLTARLWESAFPSGADLKEAAELRFSDLENEPAYIPPRY